MDLTRREVAQMLAALGLGAGLTGENAAAAQGVSATDVNGALAIQGRDLPPDTIERILPALQRSLAEVQRVRAVEIEDAVGLPLVFSPSTDRGR